MFCCRLFGYWNVIMNIQRLCCLINNLIVDFNYIGSKEDNNVVIVDDKNLKYEDVFYVDVKYVLWCEI